MFNSAANRIGTEGNLVCIRIGTGDCKQQGRRVAKVPHEDWRLRAGRKYAQRAETSSYIVERLTGFPEMAGKSK